MKRWEIINTLIKRHGYTRYLEIGLGRCECFNQIEIETKIGVDPSPEIEPTDGGFFCMSSNAFFGQAPREWTLFDIVFIDGLHEAGQLMQDIVNSSLLLLPGGTIVVHDLLPTTEAMQQVPRIQTEWTGDCWRAWAAIKSNQPHLNMRIVDTDYGVGIIQPMYDEIQPAIISRTLNWQWYTENRHQLGVVSVEEFKK